MKKGIIFDLDGTLWDTTKQVVPAWNICLRRHGIKEITYKDMESYMGKTLEDISNIIMPKLPFDKGMEILNECCLEEQIYLRKNGGTLYPNLEKTLQILLKDYNLYIVSNCQNEYLYSFFIAHKLKKYFDDFETHGNTNLNKGENIRLIVERNNIVHSVYVGDTQIDKDAADYAGISFIYASYGFGNLENQQYKISKFSDLAHIISNII